MQKTREIESIDELIEIIKNEKQLNHVACQDLDLSRVNGLIQDIEFRNCMFLGCTMSVDLQMKLLKSDNLIFPKLDVPYNPYRARLYSIDSLYRNYDPEKPETYELTPDYIIYKYYRDKGKHYPDSIYETLAQKLHDHSITDAMMDILQGMENRKVVAIMGGHGLSRDSEDFLKVSKISKELVEKGFLMLSGGGPGAMEATHLGAWMAGRDHEELEKALQILSEAPHYSHSLWLSKAFEVIRKFPKIKNEITDIGIPTWLYGHEQATPFASLIAKYFENSVREEGLLGLALGGIIYTPGSAGTIQEIFQDATQNHYKSYDMASPMIFLNKKYWTDTKPVYPLLYKLAEGKEYQKLLKISDSIPEIINELEDFRLSGKME